jgi:hypothetical protein
MATSQTLPFPRLLPRCGRSSRRPNRIEPQPPTGLPPVEPPAEPDESGEPDEIELPCTDDADWDVFIPDDDCDPLPEPGDFWIDDPEELADYRYSVPTNICE